MSFVNAIVNLSTSASPEDQLRHLDQAITEIKHARAKGQEIPESDYDTLARFLEATTLTKFVVAEKMSSLGPALKPALIHLLGCASDPEIKTLTALMLRTFGDLSVVPVLLDALRRGDQYFSLVSQALAESGITEAAPIIFEFITSRVTIEQYDLLAQSLAALRKLHFEIPEIQRRKWLSDPKCHPYVRSELGVRAPEWNSSSSLPK
jgi:hypothetical protein